jgi:hypothetical protein
MVDGNELNYLVSRSKYSSPYFIDVDSYKTPNYPATAIMPSIRDWHSSKFTKMTDWFSFAIIACQLFVGIHPFKGSHPSYSKRDMKKRMLDNVSIFNPKAKVPMSVRDFSHIPSEYRIWFLDLFEKGNRTLPPSEANMLQIITTKTRVDEVEGNLVIKYIMDYTQRITQYHSWRGYEAVSKHEIIFLQNGNPLVVEIKGGKLSLHNQDIFEEMNWKASQILVTDNSLFSINEGKVTEIRVTCAYNKIFIAPGSVWNILPHAHKVLDGLIYQNILGKPHLDFFYKVNEKTNHSIISIPELEGYRIIDGKHENRVCVIIGFRKGKYDEFIFRFDEKYSRYSCIKTEDVDSQDINMTVLDKGLALMLGDESLRIFSNNPDHDKINVIKDNNLNSRMRLCHKGNEVRFYTDSKLYSLKMGAKR